MTTSRQLMMPYRIHQKKPESIIKQVSGREYERQQQYLTAQPHGRILTPDGLRIVCAGFDNNPEKIGRHMPEMPAKFGNEGIVE